MSLSGGMSSAAWTIVAVPGPNSASSRPASSLSLSTPSQTRLGRASARLAFLPGLAAGAGAGAAAASPLPVEAAAPSGAGAAAASPRALARIMSILLGALGAAGAACGAAAISSESGSGCGAGILAGLGSSASRRSSRPMAARSAVISTSRRSIRSGPRTGIGMSRSTPSLYQGAKPFLPSRGIGSFSPSIFFWSWIRPLIRACGVGGQPGM